MKSEVHMVGPAVRAFERLWWNKCKEINEQHEYDRHFDGGEWSDSFYSDLYVVEYVKVMQRVADRFKVDPHEMSNYIESVERWNIDRMWLRQERLNRQRRNHGK